MSNVIAAVALIAAILFVIYWADGGPKNDGRKR